MRHDLSVVETSVYTKHMCNIVIEGLKKVDIIDMWLVGCFLPPFLAGYQFCSSEYKRSEYQVRGEALTRILVEWFSKDCVSGQENNGLREINSEPQMPPNRSKRTFSQLEFMDNLSKPSLTADEVSRYLSIEALKFVVEPKWFEEDRFAVIKFWYEIINQFPLLYRTALRVFSTTVSSAASKRVVLFSKIWFHQKDPRYLVLSSKMLLLFALFGNMRSSFCLNLCMRR